MANVNIITKLLTPNSYSRPRTKITKVKGIVVHWTASPKGRNVGVWNYFEARKSGKNGYGSAHYIVDLDGTIWQCIPDNEIAYHVGSSTYTSQAKTRLGSSPNYYTLGIEFCIIDNNGKMNTSTWNEGAKLVAHLLKKFGLTTNDIWLHHEVVGWKDCHRYFVNNPSEYKRFKSDVAKYMSGGTTTTPTPKPPTNSSTDVYYTVKSGDTLWGIASDYNTTVQELRSLNSTKDLEPLSIGEKILVKKGQASTKQYQVVSGDTLWGIARKFDTTVDTLKDMNKDVDVYALQIGDYLNIPSSSSSTPTTTTTPKPTNTTTILPNKTLRFGDTGEDVKKLQNALNKLNFKVGSVDGIFGYDTLNALKRYQSMYYGLTVDGIFGANTREHMLKQLI